MIKDWIEKGKTILRQRRAKWTLGAVIATLLGVTAWMIFGRRADADNTPVVETGEVTVQSLVSSVGATGKIVGIDKRDVSAPLMNVEVTGILVEVGDRVVKGQPLIQLDTQDIQDDLTLARSNLARSQQKNEINNDNAARNVDDANRTKNYQDELAKSNVETAKRNLENARSDYETANDQLHQLDDKQEQAKQALAAATADRARAYNVYLEKQQQMEIAKGQLAASTVAAAALDGLGEGETVTATIDENTVADTDASTLLDQYNQALTEYVTAKTALENATNAQAAAQNAYMSLSQQRLAKETEALNLSRQADNYQTTYDNQQKAYDNTLATQDSNVSAAQNSQQTTALANTDSEQKQVKQYRQQLADGTVLAPIDGLVTAIDVEPGDIYTKGTLVTIQDCSAYEIEAEIGEYDISDIQVGQKVLIKTDATRDEELMGKVTFVSPAATTGSANGVTYTVKIALDSKNDRLRLDMTASLSIITKQHDNVLTVPYNAIQEDVDGQTYVEVYQSDGETQRINVEVILESNYYTGVSSPQLQAGQKVIVVTEETVTNAFEAMRERNGF